MLKGKGFKLPDPAALARFKPAHHLLGTASPTFPPECDLEPFAPPVMDQGETESCGGHGTAVGVATTLAARGTPLPFVPSPKGIYDNARERVRGTRPDGSLEPLTDSGIDPITLLDALAVEGVRAIRAPTRDGRFSDCDPATINDPETLDDDEESQKDVLVGEYSIDPTQPTFAAHVAACIGNAKASVGVGIVALGPFQDWKAGDPPLDAPADRTQVDHWVDVLGYRTAPDGSLIFKIRNSWSAAWGMHGCIEVTAGWLSRACAIAIVFDVQQKAAA